MTDFDISKMNYVSRDEFEVFERSAGKSFQSIESALRELRVDVQRMSSKGTDWKAIFAGSSLLLGVIVAVGGVIAWGMNEKIDANMRLAQENNALLIDGHVTSAVASAVLDAQLEHASVTLEDVAVRLRTLEKEDAVMATKVDSLETELQAKGL